MTAPPVITGGLLIGDIDPHRSPADPNPTGALDTISVVIPTCGAAEYLDYTLKSILKQTRQPNEIVIVDDGVAQPVRRYLEAFVAASLIPTRLIDGPQVGIAAAHQVGVAAARSRWVAIMHDDDIALPNRLERQLEAASAQPHVVAWGTSAYHINARGRVLGLSNPGCGSVEDFREVYACGKLVGNIIHGTALFRRDAFFAVGGYDSEFDGAEDLDLFERMAAVGPIVSVNEPLLLRRIHAQSVSAHSFRRIQRLCRVIEARSARRARSSSLRPLRDADAWLSVRDWSAFLYHRGARLAAEGRPFRAGLCLIGSAVCWPTYPLRRLANQLGGLQANPPPVLQGPLVS